MNKITTAAIILIFIPFFIKAESSVSAGSFISVSDDSGYSPSYIYMKGGIDYFFDNGMLVSSDFDFLYGITSADDTDKTFTNYLNGSTRLLAGYNYDNKIYAGTLTSLNFFSDDDDYSAKIQQGNSAFSMKRTAYITEELFVKGSIIDKKLNFYADLGYKFQKFSNLEDYNATEYSGAFKDSDLFAFGHISYGTFLAPFAEVRFSNDLNDDDTFNLSDYRAGLEGSIKMEEKLHLIYQAYYKRLQSSIINENNHIVLYSRMRYSPAQPFDIFFDGYFEYSIDDTGNTFFVNRNLSLLGRYWIFEKIWSLSTGMTIIFDKITTYDSQSMPHEKFFVPLWPFVRTDIYFFKSDSVLRNLRGFFKFITKLGESQADYSNYSFRVDSGICATIGYFEPSLSFRWLDSGDEFVKTAGFDLSLTARF